MANLKQTLDILRPGAYEKQSDITKGGGLGLTIDHDSRTIDISYIGISGTILKKETLVTEAEIDDGSYKKLFTPRVNDFIIRSGGR